MCGREPEITDFEERIMPKIIEGNLVAVGKRFAIVAARWNDIFSDKLLSGACDTLVRHGVEDDAITVFRCPGCFELPQVAARAAETGQFEIGRASCRERVEVSV